MSVDRQEESSVRIATWNINGLRACLRRPGCDHMRSMRQLLDFLDADIVCFQETKMVRQELSPDLGQVEGWDSYFSFCKTRTGYSGVATFVRSAVSVPVAAAEGITGILDQNMGGVAAGMASVRGTIPSAAGELSDSFTDHELAEIDQEGRCVCTDHGCFVVFNLYVPAITTEDKAAERFAFKLRLLEALQLRMEASQAAGKAVFLIGDLNISPFPLDSCDPGDSAAFVERRDRQWFHQLLSIHGFVDMFRHFHPTRSEAYSCWSTASSARVNNYGARIDFILLGPPKAHCAADDARDKAQSGGWPAPGARAAAEQCTAGSGMHSRQLLGCVTACDIWQDAQGSDHAPVRLEMVLPLPLPRPSNPPPLSTRFLLTGTQGKLTAWLKVPQLSPAPGASQALSSAETASHLESQPGTEKLPLSQQLFSKPASAGSLVSRDASDSSLKSARHKLITSGSTAGSKGKRAKTSGQQSLTRFVKQPATCPTQLEPAAASPSDTRCAAQPPLPPPAEPSLGSTSGSAEPTPRTLQQSSPQHDGPANSTAVAKAAWSRIQESAKPPLCSGHKEPCVIREVKKKGPNKGRLFHVCARPDGVPPKGRCDFFAWVGSRTVRGEPAVAPTKKQRLK